MTLHMVQLAPDLRRLIRWAEARHLLHARLEDDLGYALHAVLRAAFDTQAPAPFALIRHPSRAPTLLAYSAQPASALREQAAAFAEPDVSAAVGLPTMADKEMPERFPTGRLLGFTLRARPIVRTDRDGNRDRTRRGILRLACGSSGRGWRTDGTSGVGCLPAEHDIAAQQRP